MIIPFDGYRIVLLVRQAECGSPGWEAVVMEGLTPCVVSWASNPLDAISDVTVLYHDTYLQGKELVRKHYWFGKSNPGDSTKDHSAN